MRFTTDAPSFEPPSSCYFWNIVAQLAPALIGAAGSLIGGSKQASAERAAGDKSAAAGSKGFDYLSGSPLATQYLPAGGAANNAIASLLGLGGSYSPGAGGVDDAATKSQLMSALNANVGKGYDVAFVNQIQQMVNSGASMGSISNVLNDWGSRTTSSGNQGAKSQILGTANNPVMSQAQPGSGNGQGAHDAAFQNYLNSTGYQFQLGEGQRAVTSSRAAGGVLGSGGTNTQLMKFGQGLASTGFNNYLSQLSGVAQQGLAAGSAIGGAASQAGAIGASSIMNGYSNAAGTQGSMYGNLFSDLGNAAGNIFGQKQSGVTNLPTNLLASGRGLY